MKKRVLEKLLSLRGELGLTGEWASKPISLYGRNSASGTYGFFKEHTLKNGDYKDSVKEQPGSAAVVQGVTVDHFAIGIPKFNKDVAVRYLKERGATPLEGNFAGFHIKDPDGVRVQISAQS